MRLVPLLLAALAALPVAVPRPAAAHPHVFIDADAALVFGNDGRLVYTNAAAVSLLAREDLEAGRTRWSQVSRPGTPKKPGGRWS